MIKILFHKKGINKYNYGGKTYSYIITNNLLTIRILNKIIYIKL